MSGTPETPNPQAGEDLSLVAWRNSTVPFAEAATATALLWHDRAQAARDLGAKQSVVEQLERGANLYRQAALLAQQFYGDVTTRNQLRFNRLFQPRYGSLAREAASDNTTAVRDHVNFQRRA